MAPNGPTTAAAGRASCSTPTRPTRCRCSTSVTRSSRSAGQHVPNGYYNLATMTTARAAKGAVFGNCSACMDARSSPDDRLIDHPNHHGSPIRVHLVGAVDGDSPLAAGTAIASSPGLANPNSFVPVCALPASHPRRFYPVSANEFPESPSSATPSSCLRCPPFLGKLTFPAVPLVRK